MKKNPRSSSQSPDFGLIAWLEGTRVALPLKGVECRLQVTGVIASVEMDQIYHQNTGRPLDCTYTFPLPAGAAVHRCELQVNGRIIRAKVEAREEAQRLFLKQKAAGRRAALVESERENIFTLSLGNVQPDDLIVVRFAWFQVLDRAGAGLRLLVPACPGVRYIPGKPLLRASSGRGIVDDTDQVPDASRITPPRIDALHPDAAYVSITGRLSLADVESGSVSSPSHPLLVRESDGAVSIELSTRGAVPDRDFVLSWRETKVRQLTPQAWHWTEGTNTYALVQLRAPEHVQMADNFPQDLYFLVDRSGSMSGAKWQQTCQALLAFVRLLGPEDRVWITLFESAYRDFAEAPMPASGVLADRGFQQLELLGTDGGTELLPAAIHVLNQISRHSAGRRASVVLITDGQVGNDEAVMQAFRQAPGVRLHTFGIDTAVNDAFLKSLARQQRGSCWLQTPHDDIAGTIAGLGSRLRRPVLTDLSVEGAWEPGCEMWPDLHAEEVVPITLRGDTAGAVEFSGRLPDGREHRFAADSWLMGSVAVRLLWAKDRIAALLASGRQPEAIALAREHNLICEGAAFIAWDEAEQVQIAEEVIVQTAMTQHFAARYAPLPSLRSKVDDYVSCMRFSAMEDDIIVSDVVLEASEACQMAAIPEPVIKALLEWAQSSAAAAVKRLTSLQSAAGLIARMRSTLDGPMLAPLVERIIRRALSGTPEELLMWADECQLHHQLTIRLRDRLLDARAPENVVDRLIGWTLENGQFHPLRLEDLNASLGTLHQLPFSEESQRGYWQGLLDKTGQASIDWETVAT